MADAMNTSTIQHITELDFDISKIDEQFKEIENKTKNLVNSIDSILQKSQNFKIDFDEKSIENDIKKAASYLKEDVKIQLVNENQLKNQIENVKKLTNAQASSVASSIIKENQKTIELQRREQQKTSEITIRNAQEQATIQRKLDAQIALERESNIQKQATLQRKLDAQIALEKEKSVQKQETFRLQSELKIQQEMVKQANKIELAKTKKSLSETDESVIKKINTLYERSSTLVKNIRNSNIDNEELTERINANLEESKLLWDKIHSGSQDVTDEIKNQVKQLDLQTDYLESQFKTTKNLSVPAPESMFKSWGDKFKTAFKTAFAFRMTQYAEEAVVETLRTLKEVEFGVMEITRILNDSSIDVQGFTHDIFDLAIEYGRTFEEAQEIVLRFAQTGKTASESLQMAADTMLALNTAELNTEEATQSLIGVMQQWGYTTEEYLGVIDRINITADNFAVTSQDLVDALLKSSSVAKNAGLSFEELIGILTVMKEASGAAGKEVGNAAKTILTYLQRPTSLEYFDSIGIEVYANKITGELLPAMEILQNMSNKWNSSSQEMQNNFMDAADKAGLFNEEIAESLGVMEDYSGATDAYTKALADSTTQEERNMATKAANVHRLNYYIALMENFSKVQEVVTGMQEADGYSMRENAKYMDTLAAKYNQFITTLKEIATTAGEGGLTDVAKWALDLATNFAQLMTTTEGMVSVLGSLLGIIILIKRESIGKVATDLITTINFSSKSLQEFFKIIATGNVSLSSFKAAMGGITATNIAGWAGVAVTAISLLSSVINKINEEIKKSRQESIEYGNETFEQATKINKLVVEYENLEKSQSKTEEQEIRLKELNQEIIGLLKERNVALDDLKQGTDNYSDSLKNLTLSELENMLPDLSKATISAEKNLQDAFKAFQVPNLKSAFTYIDTAKESLKELDDQVVEYLKNGDEVSAKSIQQSYQYKFLSNTIASTEEALNSYVNAATQEAIILDLLKNGYPETQEEIESFNQRIIESVGISDSWNSVIEDIVNNSLPGLKEEQEDVNNSMNGFIGVSDEVTYYLEQMESKISEVTNGLSQMKNAYSTLSSAMNEYNENGYFSIDTLSKLIQLEPRYLQYLIDENGNLKLNEQALRETAIAEMELYQARYLQSMLDMVTSIKSESDALAVLGEFNIDAKSNVDSLNESLEKQIALLIAAGTISEETGQKLKNALAAINEVYDNSKIDFSDENSSYGSSGYYGGGYSGESWYDKQVESFERLNRMGQKTTQQVVDFYRQMANAANISADDRIDAEDRLFDAIKAQIEETKQKQIDALNSQRDAIESQAQAQINSLNSRKDRISNEIDEEIDALNKKIEKIEEEAQAQIDALKKVEKENDRIREKEEYERNRADILEDIASYESRSGIDARKSEREARKNLEDLDREYKEKLEDYAIEDKIEQIEAYRDAQIESIRDQIEELQEYKDEQISAIDSQIESINKRKEEELKAIDEQIAYVNEKFNESNVNMMAYAQVFGDEIYNQYVGEFIEPMANGMVYGFNQANDMMLENAKNNASSIYYEYNSKLINPLKNSFNEISSLLYSSYASFPKLPSYLSDDEFLSARVSKNNYSRTYNSNVNVNANVRNETDMNLLSNKILNQLTSGFKNIP